MSAFSCEIDTVTSASTPALFVTTIESGISKSFSFFSSPLFQLTSATLSGKMFESLFIVWASFAMNHKPFSNSNISNNLLSHNGIATAGDIE